MSAAARPVMTFLQKVTVHCRRCYHRSVPSASPDPLGVADAITEDRTANGFVQRPDARVPGGML